MDLISAIKSGKPFKRKEQGHYCKIQNGMVVIFFEGVCRESYVPHFSLEGVVATDWEIQEEKIELTAEQTKRAIKEGTNEADYARSNLLPYQPLEEFVLKELGFKDI